MKLRTITLLSLAMLALFVPGSAPRAGEFFFHNGDAPIVFLGDSITEQNRYTALIEAYLLTRYPQWHVTFRNAGWSGDTAWFQARGDFDQTLRRDVLARHPQAVLINFGVNDAGKGDNAYWKHVEALTKIIKELKAKGIRAALLSPSALEGNAPRVPAGNSFNDNLLHFLAGERTVAEKQEVPFVNNLQPMIKIIEDGRKAGVLGSGSLPALTEGGLHPNWAGSLVLASLILKGLGATDLVSLAEIDAPSRQVVQAVGCTITMVETNPTGIVFRRTDDALPWPIPLDSVPALKLPGFDPLHDLNRYELKITGLSAPRYALTIDDQTVGQYSREELNAGVNLALVKSPITEQASRLLPLMTEKNNEWMNRWRSVELFTPPPWLQGPKFESLRQEAFAGLDKRIADLEDRLDKLRQPQPHIFKLIPAPAQ